MGIFLVGIWIGAYGMTNMVSLLARLLGLCFALLCASSLLCPAAHAQIATFVKTDIGSPGATGVYSYSSPTYSLSGAGGGISGTSDSFSLASVPATGNVEMIAKVTSQQNTSAYAVAGLMIRDTTAAGSRHAFVSVSPQNGVNFTARTTANEQSTTTLGPSIAAPTWLRLVLSQSSISGFTSADGITWKLVGKTQMTMPTTFQVGFAVSSNVNGTLSAAQFQNVAILTNVPQRSANMKLWLRSDVDVQYDGSNKVSKWLDQSDNANHATQPTSANQPSLLFNDVNGFSSVNLTNSPALWMQLPAGFKDFTAGMTIFVVTSPTSYPAAGTRLLDFGNGGTANSFYMSQPSSSLFRFSVVSAGVASNADTAITLGAYKIYELVHTGAETATAYTNGVAGTPNTNMNNVPNVDRASNFIGKFGGGGLNYNGKIAELIILDKGASGAERISVESYLSAKYGITYPLSAPTINSAYRVYSAPQQVTITPVPGTVTYFTDDGTDPNSSGTRQLYTGAITVSATKTLKAIAWAPGSGNNNAVATGIVQIDPYATAVYQPGLQFWLRADNGVILNGATAVSEWKDVSGNGRDFVQATAANQPTLMTNQQNGLPAISFDGTNDKLKNSSDLANWTGVTTFVVVDPTDTAAASGRVIEIGNGTTNNNTWGISQPAATGGTTWNFFTYNGTTGKTLAYPLGWTLNQYQLIESTMDNTSQVARLFNNGVQGATTTAMPPLQAISRTSNYIGASTAAAAHWTGRIAEIISFNRELGSSERAAVESYLFHRYALKVNPPTISPGTGVYGTVPLTVTISGDPGAQLRYTLDNSEPSASSPLYTGPFTISNSTVVKAIAIQSWDDEKSTAHLALDPLATSIPSDYISWLRSDWGVSTSGTNVTSWVNFSGTGDASQSTTSKQPQLLTNQINGHPSLGFSASNSQFLNLSINPPFNLTNGHSVFVIARPDTVTSGASAGMTAFSSGATTDVVYLNNNGSPYALSTQFGSAVLSANGLVPTNAPQLLESLVSSSGSFGWLYQNSLLAASGSMTVSGFSPTLGAIGSGSSTGTGNWFNGQIAEVLAWGRSLSDSERRNVEAYLMRRYELSPAPTVTFSVPTNTTLTAPTQVAITAPVGATIYWSTTGPATTSSPVYTQPINVSYSQTIYALAVLQGLSGSASATYTLDAAKWPAPSGSDMTAPRINLQVPTPAQ